MKLRLYKDNLKEQSLGIWLQQYPWRVMGWIMLLQCLRAPVVSGALGEDVIPLTG